MVLVWLLVCAPIRWRCRCWGERSLVPEKMSLSILHSVSSNPRLENFCRHLETVKFGADVWAELDRCPASRHIKLLGVFLPLQRVLSHSNDVTDQRVRRACVRSVGIVSQGHCDAPSRFGRNHPGQQCHET